ncbi:hypothetical protein H9S92_12100, partial [Lewinella lacunae]
LGNAGGKQRLGFTTTLPFDEIELYLSSTLTLLGSVRVFYAFEEDPLCDADCQTAIIPSNGFTPSIVGARTSFSGGILCIGCSITSTGDAIDDNLGNNASFNYGISVGETFTLSVDIGAAQPAGSDVGFVVAPDGILGLLDLSVLSTMRIRTYLGGAPVENVQLDQNLVSVDLLPGGRQSLSFRTSAPYDEVQLVTTSGVSLLGGLDIFNAFIRYDTDLDGVPDCIDKCVGDDNILNSAGLPLACNPECMLNAGVDISSCPEFGTGQAQLPPAMAGQTWSADPGNPSPATVDALGVVTGLSVEGIYTFILSDGVCSDTVQVNYVVSGTDLACNDPLVGPGVIVDDEMTFTGICILCADADASNVVDTDLENFLEYDDLVSLLVQSSLVSVKDTNNTYPAGTRVGYVIEFPTGLLDLNVLSSVQLVTYLDNQQQEIASSASLLGVGLLGAGENLQRIGFTTSLPFDEVEIVYNPTVGALSTLRVYYAFTEAPGCPFSVDPLVDPGALCIEPIIASADYCGRINYDETGINDLLCVACTIEPLSALVDDDLSTGTLLDLTASVAGSGTIAVTANTVFPGGYEAGFVVGASSELLGASLLGGISIATYLNGAFVESFTANDPLVRVTLLSGSADVAFIGFPSTAAFNEVRISVGGLINASVLGDFIVYYAYVRADSDGDGVPDCLDKCCAGDDQLDGDGNGIPDACDGMPVAVNDTFELFVEDPVVLDVLANDDFGPDLPGTNAIRIVLLPENGVATVNDNGTPADPTDDFIDYLPAA